MITRRFTTVPQVIKVIENLLRSFIEHGQLDAGARVDIDHAIIQDVLDGRSLGYLVKSNDGNWVITITSGTIAVTEM